MIWFWRSAKQFWSVDLDTLVSWRIPLLLSQSKYSLVSYSPWLSERSVLIFWLVSISSRLKKVLQRVCIYRSQFLRQKSHLKIAVEVVIKNYEVSRAIQWPYWHWVNYIWVNDVSDFPSSSPSISCKRMVMVPPVYRAFIEEITDRFDNLRPFATPEAYIFF